MKTYLSTTFTLLREHSACKSGYIKLAKYLGGVSKYGDNTPISLLVVLKSNGVGDCLWCLQVTQQNSEKIARLLACDFAESVLPIFEKKHPKNTRPRVAIEMARAYVLGNATKEQLANARADARADARTAARDAAFDAADAAFDAARAAAWATSRNAVWAAVDAAWYAAEVAAIDTTVEIEQKKQATIIKGYLKTD